ncbi:hypothetical protein NWF32_31280 [Pseudomonas qingdaonensis]|nr:hypothetical protein [Pseudomonas qingdaonensis]
MLGELEDAIQARLGELKVNCAGCTSTATAVNLATTTCWSTCSSSPLAC